MRLVHEIYRRAQVSGPAFSPYAIPVAHKGKHASGGFTELLITAPALGGGPDEVIEIEGDAASIRAMLVEAIEVIDSCAAEYLKEGRLAKDWKSHVTEVPEGSGAEAAARAPVEGGHCPDCGEAVCRCRPA